MVFRPRVTTVLLVLVVLYGAFLRFDAVTLSYGPVVRPTWLRALQETRRPESLLRPAGYTWSLTPKYPHKGGDWTQYAGDSYTYLQNAREMRSFYGAHFREPVFVFATWVSLQLLKNQDVAVSFASAAFSVLAIFATYLLGASALSRWVGLGAALAVAVDYQTVSESVIGVRDDAFVCAVLLMAWAFLRYLRTPSRGHAITMGVLAGVSCLVRIFSVLVVVPGLFYLWLTDRRPWRARLGGFGIAVVTAVIIVAPYLINCWLVLGDPLRSFNVHSDIYRATEGQAVDVNQSTGQYIWSQVRSRPARVADTVTLGMTTYPFLNKWRGFDCWIPGAGKFLSWAALAGLFLFLGSRDTRLLLLILAASLVPFSLTWKLIAEWRFTEHAYPFFLIAAAFAIGRVAGFFAPSNLRQLVRDRPSKKTLAFWGGAGALVAASVWIVAGVLPVLADEEAIRSNEAITIEAGRRDWSYFTRGWSSPTFDGSVSWRVSQGPLSEVRVPLPRVQDYGATVRLDPSPGPTGADSSLPAVRVSLNDQPLATLELRWNPERVGGYELRLPAHLVRAGMNRLGFVVDPKPGSATAIRLWMVRVRPPGA